MTDWYDEVFRDRVRHGLKVTARLFHLRSEFQTVEVIDTEQYGRVLVLDGIFQTSEAEEYHYHEMLVHPAMVTAPAVRRVLVVGGGDGGTVREVLRHAGVERVVMIEIDPVVVEACRAHLASFEVPWDDPRLDLRFEDGVSFVRSAVVEPFDVILLDGSDPVGPSEGLFGRAFHEGCRRLLRPGGVFAAQTESPFLFPEVFRDTVHLLRDVHGRADPYFGPVPLYAAGSWSWTHAGGAGPLAIDEARAAAVEPHLRYYCREVHRGALALPPDVRRLLEA